MKLKTEYDPAGAWYVSGIIEGQTVTLMWYGHSESEAVKSFKKTYKIGN